MNRPFQFSGRIRSLMGAVLIAAIGTVVIGLLVLGPHAAGVGGVSDQSAQVEITETFSFELGTAARSTFLENDKAYFAGFYPLEQKNGVWLYEYRAGYDLEEMSSGVLAFAEEKGHFLFNDDEVSYRIGD